MELFLNTLSFTASKWFWHWRLSK